MNLRPEKRRQKRSFLCNFREKKTRQKITAALELSCRNYGWTLLRTVECFMCSYRSTKLVSGCRNNFPPDTQWVWDFLLANRIGTIQPKWSGHKWVTLHPMTSGDWHSVQAHWLWQCDWVPNMDRCPAARIQCSCLQEMVCSTWNQQRNFFNPWPIKAGSLKCSSKPQMMCKMHIAAAFLHSQKVTYSYYWNPWLVCNSFGNIMTF